MSSLGNRTVGVKDVSSKKSKLQWKRNVSLAAKDRWKKFQAKKVETEESANDSGNITTTMRRIVDLKQVAKNLWCKQCCKSISLRDFVDEQRHGLASTLKVKCQFCGIIVLVDTEKFSSDAGSNGARLYDVNKKLALGK